MDPFRIKGSRLLAWLGLLLGSCGSPDLPYPVRELARDVYDSRLDGDIVAYEKGQDIYLYRFSTGANWAVTHDGPFVRDDLLGTEAGVVWFSSSLGNGPPVLRAYEVNRGRLRGVLQGSRKIEWGGVHENQAILNIDDAWWLCTPDSQERMTPEGSTTVKFECVRGADRLVWSGLNPAQSAYPAIYCTLFVVPWTVPFRWGDRSYGHLCGGSTGAAWVAGPEGGGNRVEIELRKFQPWQGTVVETFEDSHWEDIVDLEGQELVYVRTSGNQSVFSLVHYQMETAVKSTLYASGVRKVRPLLEGRWISYVSRNCPDRSCEELCVFDRSRRTSCRLTTSGSGHEIVRADLEGDRLVWTDRAPQTGHRLLMAELDSS